MKKGSIILLAGRSASTPMVYNFLRRHFPVDAVILEDRVPRRQFLEKRARRLGWATVLGQVLFRGLMVPWLRLTSGRRRRAIEKEFGLDASAIDPAKIVAVTSVNSDEAIAALKASDPEIVVVNGTRIISKEVLGCVGATFVNMHAGITPLYRGVHGAYWALVKKDPQACGVTVHRVDPGIDTGGILEQGLIQPELEDNFVTYPLLQLGAGLPLLKKAIEDLRASRSQVRPAPAGTSQLWSHPTLWQYLRGRVRLGVK
jgi:folate-dependent phosphoribosylglycinamide formyltransferase PurN